MKCSVCGNEVDASLQVCPNCGNKLIHDDAAEDELSPISMNAPESAGMPEKSQFDIPKEDMESPVLPVASILCSMVFGIPGIVIGLYGYFHCRQQANRTMCLVGVGISTLLFIICAIAVGIVIAS